jgi:hypothetical protein
MFKEKRKQENSGLVQNQSTYTMDNLAGDYRDFYLYVLSFSWEYPTQLCCRRCCSEKYQSPNGFLGRG